MLMNSNELEFMYGNKHDINEISIKWGIIGAGQKGNKEADLFAGYTFSNGKPCYPTLAVNLSESDMMHLKNIEKEDRIHFKGLKGAARTPSVVTDMFDEEINPDAHTHLNALAEALGRKFTDENGDINVDQFLICLGAGGGVGTGWGSLVLQLIRQEFFPRPVSLLISLPSGDPDEINNAIVLLNEIDEFFKEQDRLFSPSDIKPLTSVILNDNTQMQKLIESQKGTKDLKNRFMNWKEEANNNIVSTLHEINLIPQNFGSDNVTYDPSDLIKLFTLPARFLTIGKARMKKLELTVLESSIQKSLNDGFFSCQHQYQTATMYGGFILRPSGEDFFKDVSTETKIRKVLSEYRMLDEIAGKFGDPIWDADYAVIYSIFAGMEMPARFISLAKEGKELAEKQEQMRIEAQRRQEEEMIDISFATDRVKKNTFSPYAKNNGFGGNRFGNASGSAFKREVSATIQTTEKEETGQKNPFGVKRKIENTDALKSLKQGNPFGKKKQ
ncbi:cell division protein FtsZ [Bacillus sp. BP-3]|uniref:cell division protein FtsZ n=1 Tax=Bacillus sp. BP-3 TaxID=3022773 RepID=UPI00232DD322|nr:cell division protein FtsZ [Bacillus sp. BP-3]MDC2867759.1 cell division protein FtsZ [Bacillus sp. BP-3]